MDKLILMLSAGLMATSLAFAATAADEEFAKSIKANITANTEFCSLGASPGYSLTVKCDGDVVAAQAESNFTYAVSLVKKQGLKIVSCNHSNATEGMLESNYCYLSR